ncbi:MAG TPA: carbonic anhydrase [Candidatus Aquilonibacter sp.]
MRRTAGALTAAAFAGAPRAVPAAYGGGPVMTPDQAVSRLMAGNAKFVAGSLEATRALAERRADVADEQRPFAMVLCCADSRVPPEHIFDQSVGDLFVCRVAGNILEPGGLGSFEYAVANIGSPAVLIVLGHQRCGAVTDAIKLVKSHQRAPGSIQTIVAAIEPAITATAQGAMSESEYTEAVVRSNAKLVARETVARSAILEKAVAAQHLKVVAARYAIDSGHVTLLS